MSVAVILFSAQEKSRNSRANWSKLEHMYSTLVMETVVEKYVKFFKSTFHRNNHYFAKYVCCEILNFLMLFFNFYLTNVFLNGNFWNYGWELLEFNKYSLWEQKVSNFFALLILQLISKFRGSNFWVVHPLPHPCFRHS